MSDVPQGPGWWQASDHRWYPPETHPNAPQGPSPYAWPSQWGQPPARTTTNGLAVASMVLGIVWVWWIGSILALVFGYIAKGQIARSGGAQAGRGMAIAGIVLGWVGVAILLLIIPLAIFGGVHGSGRSVTYQRRGPLLHL